VEWKVNGPKNMQMRGKVKGDSNLGKQVAKRGIRWRERQKIGRKNRPKVEVHG
jgi:hypothetical protein